MFSFEACSRLVHGGERAGNDLYMCARRTQTLKTDRFLFTEIRYVGEVDDVEHDVVAGSIIRPQH